ncbi:MAG: YeeE/YedE family protein [Calditrichaeota bacterium]|nr:MAG: YeeE/YedE family protein [Calditrichota bacterium]
MSDIILDSWEWYIAGPLLGAFVPILLLLGNKQFGISSSLLHFCSLILPENSKKILRYDPHENAWKLYFVIGIAIGAFIAVNFLSSDQIAFLPEKYYEFQGLIHLFAGGFLIGFGTRYADGCTSGHSIMGLSLLHWPSLKATLAFFAGGLTYTYLVLFFF